MFYRHNKQYMYQFCNFTHFLKAENSDDSLASSYVALTKAPGLAIDGIF